MAIYLKCLGAFFLTAGIVVGSLALYRAWTDEEYRIAALKYERNQGHIAFESEFRIAQARRAFTIYTGVGSLVTGLVGGSLLLGVGALHRKVEG